MSEETPISGKASKKITLGKVVVPYDQTSPATEPLFINYFQVAHAGGAFYIDAGVIPLDMILDRGPEATFMVLSRLVMSREVMAGLGDQITKLLKGPDQYVDVTSGVDPKVPETSE